MTDQRPVLTERQLQVLALIATGATNVAVANQLHVSAETIKTRMRVLLQRLGARDRTHAVALAYQRGLLPMPAGSTPRVLSSPPPTHRPPEIAARPVGVRPR